MPFDIVLLRTANGLGSAPPLSPPVSLLMSWETTENEGAPPLPSLSDEEEDERLVNQSDMIAAAASPPSLLSPVYSIFSLRYHC